MRRQASSAKSGSVSRTQDPAGCSGTPLPKKLANKPGSAVLTLGAPDFFEETLDPFPDGARFVTSGPADLVLVFAISRAELEGRFARALRSASSNGRIWIIWPKKSSRA